MPFWRRKPQDDGSSGSSSASSIPLPDADPQQQQQQQPQQQLELELEQPIPPPDFGGSSSSSSTDAAAAAAAAEQQQEAEDRGPTPGEDNPMLQTSLTKRFKGRFQPMQMPTYDLMMQVGLRQLSSVQSAGAATAAMNTGMALGCPLCADSMLCGTADG
jgi:hypothetical protein